MPHPAAPARMESLAARRLCAGQPDATFGNGGIAPFPLSPQNQVFEPLAGDGFYFAQSSPRSSLLTAITKLTPEWALDTAWGDHGIVDAPLQDAVLAYDKRSDRLYAAGVDAENGRLVVLRFSTEGEIDRDFGNDGVAAFTPAVADADTSYIEFNPTAAVVLRDGGVMVAVRTELGRTFHDDDPFTSDSDSDTEIAHTLIRFRNDGARKTSFGRRGVASVTTGSGSGFNNGYGDNDSVRDDPSLRTLTPLADGGFRAIFSRERVDFGEGIIARDRYGLSIDSRTIDAQGRLAASDSWTLVPLADRPPENPDNNTLELPFTVAGVSDRDGALTVIGRHSAEAARRYTLRSGGRVRSAAISNIADVNDDHAIEAALPDRRGGFYVYNVPGTAFNVAGATNVRHLRADGSPDRRFGRHGLLALRGGATPLTVDPDGRLIALVDEPGRDFRVRRYTV